MLLKRELPLGRATGTGMGVVCVCVWEGGGVDSVGLFLPCLNTRFCSRVSGQRRRDENAQMVTKALFWITWDRILSLVRRNHVLDA